MKLKWPQKNPPKRKNFMGGGGWNFSVWPVHIYPWIAYCRSLVDFLYCSLLQSSHFTFSRSFPLSISVSFYRLGSPSLSHSLSLCIILRLSLPFHGCVALLLIMTGAYDGWSCFQPTSIKTINYNKNLSIDGLGRVAGGGGRSGPGSENCKSIRWISCGYPPDERVVTRFSEKAKNFLPINWWDPRISSGGYPPAGFIFFHPRGIRPNSS